MLRLYIRVSLPVISTSSCMILHAHCAFIICRESVRTHNASSLHVASFHDYWAEVQNILLDANDKAGSCLRLFCPHGAFMGIFHGSGPFQQHALFNNTKTGQKHKQQIVWMLWLFYGNKRTLGFDHIIQRNMFFLSKTLNFDRELLLWAIKTSPIYKTTSSFHELFCKRFNTRTAKGVIFTP